MMVSFHIRTGKTKVVQACLNHTRPLGRFLKTTILLIFASFSTVFGQINKDSLHQSIKSTSGQTRINLLNKLSEVYLSENPLKARAYAEEALQISKNFGDLKGRINSLHHLGEFYISDGSYKTALLIFQEALAISESIEAVGEKGLSHGKIGAVYYFLGQYQKALDNQNEAFAIYRKLRYKAEMANTLSSIGYIYSYKGSYGKALDHFYRALKVRESLNMPEEVAKSYNSLGDFYFHQNDFVKALDNYKESYTRSIKIGSKKGIAIGLTNIGSVLAKNGNYEAALDTLFKALVMKREMGFKKDMAISYQNIGYAFYVAKNYNKALDYYFKALKINKDLGNSNFTSAIYNLLATTYADNQQFNLSLLYHEKALQNAQESKSEPQILASYESIGNTYLKKNDAVNFFFYYKKFTQLRDSLEEIEKNSQIAELQAKFEHERNNKQLAIIKKEKWQQEQMLKEQQKFIYLLLIASFLGIILLGLTYNFYKLKKRSNERLRRQNEIIKKQNEEVNEINRELKELNEKLLLSEGELKKSNQTKDKFFSIISHDLRGPLNTFTSFLSLILNHTTTFTHGQILEIVGHTEKSLKNLSTLLNNLLQWSQAQMGHIKYQPVSIGLEEAVMNTIKLFSNDAANKNITLFSIVDPGYYVKSDKNMLDFILRNLISNAIKFTPENGHIKISCAKRDNYIEVSVKDNGVGIQKDDLNKLFDLNAQFTTPGTANEKGTGLGLILCKEFVEKNGGNIWVENNNDEGSVFKFTVPLEFSTQSA